MEKFVKDDIVCRLLSISRLVLRTWVLALIISSEVAMGELVKIKVEDEPTSSLLETDTLLLEDGVGVARNTREVLLDSITVVASIEVLRGEVEEKVDAEKLKVSDGTILVNVGLGVNEISVRSVSETATLLNSETNDSEEEVEEGDNVIVSDRMKLSLPVGVGGGMGVKSGNDDSGTARVTFTTDVSEGVTEVSDVAGVKREDTVSDSIEMLAI